MDTTLRAAEKAFLTEPSGEAGERLAGELQRAGKTPVQAAEQLLEATAKAIKQLILEAAAGKVIQPTTFAVVDPVLTILNTYQSHIEEKPGYTLESRDGYGIAYAILLEDGIYNFEQTSTSYRKDPTDGRIKESSHSREYAHRAPAWGTKREDLRNYLTLGTKALEYLAGRKAKHGA